MTSLRRDISYNNPGGARLAASRAGLRPTTACRQLYLVAEEINFIEDLKHAYACIEHTKPLHVAVDIGSNDLASMTEEDEDQCVTLAESAVEICREFTQKGAGTVAIFTVIPRSGNLRCPPQVFEENRLHYNKALRAACWKERSIHIERLRGFVNDANHKPKDITSWSKDKIHCTTIPSDTIPVPSMKRYAIRVKYAIQSYIRHLSA